MINKRGQFYLIAAVIIIGVLVGFFLYNNYARTGNLGATYDLGKELKLETGNVYAYGTYNTDTVGTDALIKNWTGKYLEYSRMQGSVDNWIFLYGDSAQMTAVTFSVIDVGSVSIDTGSGSVSVKVEKEIKNSQDLKVDNDKVTIKFKDINYPFELGEGQNFFFVIQSGGSTTTS